MDRFRLVVGVDGSAAAREALRWGSRFATVLGGEILVAHALPGGAGESGAASRMGATDDRTRVDERCAELQEVVEFEWCAALRSEGAPFQVVVRPAEPVSLLVGLARAELVGGGNGGNEVGAHDPALVSTGTMRNDDDWDDGMWARPLVVVGNRGLRRGAGLDLGSTCTGVLSARRSPTLVVTRRDRAAAHLALRRILVGVDGRPAADSALAVACAVAKGFRSWVHVVQAADEGAASRVEVLRRQVDGLGLPVHVSVERGDPAEVIRAAAARIDADLVVVGSNHRGHGPRAVHPAAPSVSRQVVRAAQRPTLVVPDDGPQAPGGPGLLGEDDLEGA